MGNTGYLKPNATERGLTQMLTMLGKTAHYGVPDLWLAPAEQLEDSQSELEGSRRRLSSLKQQHQQQLAQLQQQKQGGACGAGGPCSHGGPTQSATKAESANGEVVDASAEELKRLRASLDEAKVNSCY